MKSSEASARFYDLDPTVPDDLPFYRAMVRPEHRVLELGCGTGRVLIPLAAHGCAVYGLDRSPAMLAVCREKLQAARLSSRRASVRRGDMADFDLGARFDLVLTPYRAFQDLLEDRQVAGLFRSVRRHLTDRGSLVLGVYRPDLVRLERWAAAEGELCWEVEDGNTVVTCHAYGAGIDRGRQVQRLRLVYRQYLEGGLDEEGVVDLAMRYYFPEQLEEVVTGHGFEVLERWGGYQGEPWGEGPELLLRCAPAPSKEDGGRE